MLGLGFGFIVFVDFMLVVELILRRTHHFGVVHACRLVIPHVERVFVPMTVFVKPEPIGAVVWVVGGLVLSTLIH